MSISNKFALDLENILRNSAPVVTCTLKSQIIVPIPLLFSVRLRDKVGDKIKSHGTLMFLTITPVSLFIFKVKMKGKIWKNLCRNLF